MNLIDTFYTLGALLLFTLGFTTYLIDPSVRFYNALKLVRWSVFLAGLSWVLAIGSEWKLAYYFSYLTSGLALSAWAMYPDLRQGTRTPRLVIVFFCLVCIIGYSFPLYFSVNSEFMLHNTTIIGLLVSGYTLSKLYWGQERRLKSHYVLAIALVVVSVVLTFRSFLLIFFVDAYDSNASALMIFWPPIYAALVVSVITSYLEDAFKEEELKGRTDGLTKLFNRRFWEESLQLEFNRRQRSNSSVSCLVMFDIDQFKRINYDHGHTAGDFVISNVAKVLRSQLRETDIAGRYGGDEYAVVLVDTNVEEANAFAERTRKAIEESLAVFNGLTLRTTASFGIAEFHSDIDGHTSWLKRADEALYQSKENGRNCSTIFQP